MLDGTCDGSLSWYEERAKAVKARLVCSESQPRLLEKDTWHELRDISQERLLSPERADGAGGIV
jgi:hypothetical protein